jgi:ABC-type branched-subunit amino acid transport system ATPase component
MTEPLSIEDVTSGYGEAMILRQVRLSIAAGETVALLGRNGMGKSTLLKTIVGLLPVRQGVIRLFGTSVDSMRSDRIGRLPIAYAPQEHALFQDLTVQENLRLGSLSDRGIGPAIDRAATLFPILWQRLSQKAGALSGGEQKMLVLARALLREPKLLLIDEISEGLQPSIVDRVAEVLQAERQRTGVAILLVEQHVRFALSVANRFAVLNIGEIVDVGDARAATAAARVQAHLVM